MFLRYLFALYLIVLFSSCSNEKTNSNHIISDSLIRSGLALHLNRFDTLTSNEGRYLQALVMDDTVFLKRELQDLIRYYDRVDTLLTEKLKDYIRADAIKDKYPKYINAVRFEISNSSFYPINTSITLIENTRNQEYTLNIRNYTWYQNDDGKIDLYSVNLDKSKSIGEKEWDQFITFLKESYFWRIVDGYEEEVVDGSIWTLECSDYNFNQRRYHRVSSRTPRGSFKKACNFLLKLTEEKIRFE